MPPRGALENCTPAYLRCLYLKDCSKMTDQGLRSLTTLHCLEILELHWCSQISDCGFRSVAQLSRLRRLTIAEGWRLRDEGLKALASSLLSLERLHLWGCGSITDQGIRVLIQLHGLKVLDLRSLHGISGHGIVHLTTLPLRTLQLGACHNVANHTVPRLAAFQDLTSLDLNHCGQMTLGYDWSAFEHLRRLDVSHCRHITMAHLATLPRLILLNVGWTTLTDDEAIHLAQLTGLRSLNLDGCDAISDPGVAQLTGMKALTALGLSFTQVSKRGVDHLSALPLLQSVDLSYCKKITDSALQALLFIPSLYTVRVFSSAVSAHLRGVSTIVQLRAALGNTHKMPYSPKQHGTPGPDGLLEGTVKAPWECDAFDVPSLAVFGLEAGDSMEHVLN